jgi:hypothetical protein
LVMIYRKKRSLETNPINIYTKDVFLKMTWFEKHNYIPVGVSYENCS